MLFQPGDVALGLSATANGHAVVGMTDVLAKQRLSQFLLDIGGAFAGRGATPDRMPWWVDIENPYPEGKPWGPALCGAALAAPGDNRQVRLGDGERLSHIVPHPARACAGGELASASALHASCALADTWATALFAAGDRQGLVMADRERLAALLQKRDAALQLSSRPKGWLT